MILTIFFLHFIDVWVLKVYIVLILFFVDTTGYYRICILLCCIDKIWGRYEKLIVLISDVNSSVPAKKAKTILKKVKQKKVKPKLSKNQLFQFKNYLVWWSDKFKCWHQIAQLVQHMTRNSGGRVQIPVWPGSNLSLVHQYFSHPVTIARTLFQFPGH